jgi:Trk K+ transport system NAD-binding subunit
VADGGLPQGHGAIALERPGFPDVSDTLGGETRESTDTVAAHSGCRHWTGHVIVCGLESVGLRAVQQLGVAGARVAVLDDETASTRRQRIVREWSVPLIERGANLADALFEAGIAGARAVICIESSDLRTLETVLLVRDLRADVRVIAHLDNPALARAVEETSGAATVLDVATLFAPSVVEACLGRSAHDIEIGEVRFTTLEVTAARAATLRDLYGSLVPLGVAGEGDEPPVLCPGRDLTVKEGARVTLLGTKEELTEAGLLRAAETDSEVGRARLRMVRLGRRVAGQLTSDSERSLRFALGAGVGLLVFSTVLLHLAYRLAPGHHLSLVTAAYFTVETVATVGFGDFSFSQQSTWLEIYGILLILAGTTLVTTILALLTNALVTRRIAQSLGHAEIPGMRDHVVMVGLGSVGMKILDGLLARGCEVVVVEREESNPHLGQVRARGVPLVIGDATQPETLHSVNLTRAASVAIVTSNDMTNIETGLAVRDRLGDRWAEVPVVLRVFDRELGGRLEQNFDFRHVWSTAVIAAPWFVGAALGMDVCFSFYVGSHPFLIARLPVSENGGLHDLAMTDLSARIRIIAIQRGDGGTLEHPPRRDTRLKAGDHAYLAGPYEELLRVLRRELGGDGQP